MLLAASPSAQLLALAASPLAPHTSLTIVLITCLPRLFLSKHVPMLAAQQGWLPVQAIHVLLSALVLVWLAANSSSLPIICPKLLLLDQSIGKWWSPLTDAFCSASVQLLARNLFFGYMFGRVVENTESGGALWLTYLLGAAGTTKCGACNSFACMRSCSLA
jgi:membrane associated rhomboid family serine protease